MKWSPSILIALASALCVLMITQTAAAQGKGGKGGEAAVGIDTIVLIDDPNKPFDDILAEIVGGGFLGGEDGFVEVTLDGEPIDHVVHSAELIVASIPGHTDAGEHEVMVRTGDANKESAAAMIHLGGEMRVSCISWFVSGPNDEHLHSEIHIEDENGVAVIGAEVTWEVGNVDGVYQTNTAPTADNDGHAKELTTCPVDRVTGEPLVSGSGVTGWFCCIGAGKWDNEVPPGKRACPAGDYIATVLDVTAPPFTNMVWDEMNSEISAETELIDPKFP